MYLKDERVMYQTVVSWSRVVLGTAPAPLCCPPSWRPHLRYGTSCLVMVGDEASPYCVAVSCNEGRGQIGGNEEGHACPVLVNEHLLRDPRGGHLLGPPDSHLPWPLATVQKGAIQRSSALRTAYGRRALWASLKRGRFGTEVYNTCQSGERQANGPLWAGLWALVQVGTVTAFGFEAAWICGIALF